MSSHDDPPIAGVVNEDGTMKLVLGGSEQKARSDARQLAMRVREFYDALIEQGFDESKATILVSTLIRDNSR